MTTKMLIKFFIGIAIFFKENITIPIFIAIFLYFDFLNK
jgi:hypothetical protein